MTRQFHTMSIEDREMFAHNREYNRRQEQLKKHMEQAENPLRYCFEFLDAYIQDGDSPMIAKCYTGIAKYNELLDWSESHF